jgi:O-antigen/teichoic acid export membrane protein
MLLDAHKKNISKLAKNSLITAVGNVFGLIVTPVSAILTTRVLGAELYGIYSIVQSWSSFLANISGLGFHGMNLRFIPTYTGSGNLAKAKGSILWTLKITSTVSIVVASLVFFFPGLFCAMFINKPETISQTVFDNQIIAAFRFFSVSIFFTSLYLVFQSSLNGLQEIKYKILSNEVIGSVTKIISLILLFAVGLDLYAALTSSLLQDIAILVMSFIFLVKVFPEFKDATISPEYEKKQMNKFAATLFTNSILNKYTFQMDVLFLGYFNTMREVGIYTVALRLQPLIYMPHYAIMTIFNPMIAELHAAGKMDELRSLYKMVTKWSFSVSLPIFATVVMFSREILNVFGKEFSEGLFIIVILSIGNLIHDLLGMAGNIIMMSGRIKINLINSVCIAFINIILYYFLIKNFGITGAAISTMASTLILSFIVLGEVIYIYKFHPFKKTLVKPVLSIVLANVLTYVTIQLYKMPLYNYLFVVYIVFMVLCYFVFLYLLKFDEEDRYVISKIIIRFPLLQMFKRFK